MAKKKHFSWIKTSIGIWAGAKVINYLLEHPRPIHDFKEDTNHLVIDVADFFDSVQHFKNNSYNLKVEAANAQKTIDSINRSVEKFEYKIDPQISKINELQNHISSELNHLNSKISGK